METVSAFVAIVGRPNVGKSSLLNALVGKKVAIVSDKPQTTRTRIMGVVTKENMQLVFLDTPGNHKPRTRLGDFMVRSIGEAVSGVDVGLLGSNNSLEALKAGAVGFVLNGGGIRDTDEVIMQNVPVWCKHVSQGMDQARLRYVEKNVPVAIGGVAVYPGDVIVADNDGVIVVPRKVAFDVAKYAWQEMNGDKLGRQKLYQDLGWDLDDTVIPVEAK